MTRTSPHLSRRSLLGTAAAGPALMTLAEARAQGIQPRRGGTLNTMLNPEPPVVIPGVNAQVQTFLVSTKMYQGLIKVDSRLGILPELARSWTISDDKRVYTFHLEPNVKWHDGRDFTAEDVVFSIMKFHLELSPRSRQIIQKITEAKALDAHTVRFTLDGPFEPLLLVFEATSCAIVPKHVYDGTDYRTNPANQTPMGTGPFRFVEWQRGNFLRMRRFDGYWKPGQPYLDEIIFQIMPDSQSRRLAIEQGHSQMATGTDLEPFDIPQLEANPRLRVTRTGNELLSPLSWIEVNNRLPVLSDARFRKAMAHAIDRDFIAKRLWFGNARAATSPVASATRYHDPDARLPAFDLNAAKALLDDMGLKPDAQGIRHRVRLMTMPYGEVWTRLSEYIRQALRQIGVEVTIESTDSGGYVRRLSQWEYELTPIFASQYGDPTLGVARTFLSSNIQKVAFTNTSGYSNPRVDELFGIAAREADPAKRAATFKEVQKLIIEDQPLIWLVELLFPTTTDRRLTFPGWGGNGVYTSFDDVFFAA